MPKHMSIACASCHHMTNCDECKAYTQSPLAFKAFEPKKISMAPTLIKRTNNFTNATTAQTPAICSQCENKMCFACSMYNTNFVKDAQ